MYVELHPASAFSFLQGASLPEALVDRAAELGYSALALLDRDGVYGLPRFHRAALAAGIRPIIGAELTIGGAGESGRAGRSGKSGEFPYPPHQTHPPHQTYLTHPTFRLPVLVETQQGYQNLCRLVTRMKMRAPAPGLLPRTPARWGGDPGSPPRTPARWGGKGEGALALDDLDGHTAGLVALAGRELLTSTRYGVGGLIDPLIGVF